MRLTLLFACAALWLGAAAPATAEFYTIRFQGAEKAKLGVVAGEVRAVSTAAAHDWSLSLAVGRPPTSLCVIEPERWNGSYLAYDPKGKDKGKGAVFLADETGEGTDWVLERVKGERSTVFTVQAGAGKYKGWYLDVEEEGKPFRDDKGRKATAYRVFLSEKPKKVPKWTFTVIGR